MLMKFLLFLSLFMLPGFLAAQGKPRTDGEILRDPKVKAERDAFDAMNIKAYSEISTHFANGGSVYGGYVIWAKVHQKVLSSSADFQEYKRPDRYQNRLLTERARFEMGRAVLELETEATRVAGLATLINIARMNGTPMYDEARQILTKHKNSDAFKSAMDLARKGGGQ